MQPTDRPSFANFCLRRLGSPVVPINVSEEQVDDCIDIALYYYGQYHMEGSEKTYYSYAVTGTDIQNGYLQLPENIIGAIRIFPVGDALNTNSMFNMRYQFVINDLYNISNVSVVPYYMVMNHVQFLEQLLVGQQPVRYNRHNNRFYIDQDWSSVTVGEYFLVEAYQIVDPNEWPNVWTDKFLQEYTSALIKRQWGTNLKLYSDVPLVGGVKINGQQIYNEAVMDVERLEKKMMTTYSLPPLMTIM